MELSEVDKWRQMRLSIITVNLNDAAGLRKTMESVFCQKFNDYEYIVIDGGSTDGSREVIEQNQGRLSYWVSEEDSGIYNAMNKAIRVANGEYLYFLNSGDTLCRANVLENVFADAPKEDVIIGRINFIDGGGVYHADYQPRCKRMTPREFRHTGVPHQASFIKKELFSKYGLYDESYEISADWKFFFNVLVLHKCSYCYIPVTVANFDGGGISSKNNRLMMDEIARAYDELIPDMIKKCDSIRKRVTKVLSEMLNFGLIHVLQIHLFTRLHKGNRYRQNVMQKYLDSHYSKFLTDAGTVERMGDKFPIWVCWLQGREDMPPIVERCYDSLIKYWGESCVKLITESTIRDYIDLPDYIWSKYYRNRFTKTHFSDILRVCFLQRYGGLWMDSTILMTGKLDIATQPFFSIKGKKVDDSYVSDYKWTGYCLGGASGNVLFENLRILLFEYWKKQDRLIDYYILDYFIHIVYDRLPSARQLIDGNEVNNPDVSFLQSHFDEPFNQETFDRICSTTCLHKLSWKGVHPLETSDGEETYYGHILRNPADIRSQNPVISVHFFCDFYRRLN